MTRSRRPGDPKVGARVRERRKELRLTQQQLGERVGVTRVWIRYIELGQGAMSPELQERLAQALDLPMAALQSEPPRTSSLGPTPGSEMVTARGRVEGNQLGADDDLAGVLMLAIEGLESLRARALDGLEERRTEALSAVSVRLRAFEGQLATLMVRAPEERARIATMFATAGRLRETVLKDLAGLPYPPVGALVWRARRELGLDREQFAAATQVGPADVLDVETGARSPTPAELQAFRTVLGPLDNDGARGG